MNSLHNINIERSILSSILFNPISFTEVNNSLLKEDFYLPSHKNIFNSMIICDKKDLPVDEEFIVKILKKMNLFDEDAMLEILSTNPLPHLSKYIEEIKNYSIKRTLLELINKSKETILSENYLEVLSGIESGLENIKNNSEIDSSLKIVSTDTIEALLPKFYLEEDLPIQENEITIISAKGGTGKSYLGLYLLSLLKKKHNLKVVGYFSEDDVGITKHRLDKLNDIHELFTNIDILGKDSRPKPFMQYDKSKNLEVTSDFYKFKNKLKNYDVILIDPLIAFIAGDENSNSEARFFMNLLNEWCTKENKTIILIHHHSKGENGGVRGAGAYIDAVRLHYSINKTEDNENIRLIKLEKTNHYNGKSEFKIQLFGVPVKVINNKASEIHIYEEDEKKISLPPGLQDIAIEDEEYDPALKEKENNLISKGYKFEK